MRVLVIPEDFRNDQYTLQPILAALFSFVGRPSARLAVCKDPLLAGVEQAMSWPRIEEILERYPMVDLFLLVVDRDGHSGREEALKSLEKRASSHLGSAAQFVATCAWQELEVWILAGHDLPPSWKWDEIRQEPHSKERYYEPFAMERGVSHAPGGGRKKLASEAAARYRRIRQLCAEDLAAVETRISTLMSQKRRG